MGKRIYPLNAIKYWYCYDVDELYKLIAVNEKTILEWKRKGLKTIDNKQPFLFYGCDVKAFLGSLNESNKCKTEFHQLFCMKCKEGKIPLKKQIQLIPNDNKFLKLKAICQTCKNVMFKNYKLDDLQKIKQTFNAVQVLELYDSKNTSVNPPFLDQAKDGEKEHGQEEFQLELFS